MVNPASKQPVTMLIKQYILPLLTDRGFTGRAPVLRRITGATEQVVYLQRGKPERLYVNGSVYVAALDTLLGQPVMVEPDEAQCHLRMRPQDVSATAAEYYAAGEAPSLDLLGQTVADDLNRLLDRLDQLTDADAVVAQLATYYLAQYERVFAWQLRKDDIEAARRFIRSLHARFGAEPRWAIFAQRLDGAAEAVGCPIAWRDWL